MGTHLPRKMVLKNWGVCRLKAVFWYVAVTKIKGARRGPGEARRDSE